VHAAPGELAACHRLAARFGFSEGIDNHMTLMVPGHRDRFLLAPFGLLWSEVKASDLLEVDFSGTLVAGKGLVEPTALFIHLAVHQQVTHPACVLHTHMPYATALSMLEEPRLYMASQNALGFHDDIAYADYKGLALDRAEGARLARALGNKSVLMLRNHGVLVTGHSVAEAFERLYFLERACQAQVLALSTGGRLAIAPDDIVRTTAQQLRAESCVGDRSRTELHFAALRRCWIATMRTMRVDRDNTAAESAAVIRWSIVAVLAAAVFINYVDRGLMPTAAHLLQEELGLSKDALGLLFSAFFWSYAPAQLLAGWLAERFGAWRILACGLTLWACATMLVGAAHSFGSLLMQRLLRGLGESVAFPCVSKLLATAVPVQDLGRANGFVAFGYLFGPAVGAYAGGMLLANYGWRATFGVFGALSLLWLLPWAGLKTRMSAVAVNPGVPPLRRLLQQRALWGTSVAHFSANYTYYFMLTWLPLYLVRERGFSTAAMAGITGSAYLVNAGSALSVAGRSIGPSTTRAGRILPQDAGGGSHLGSVACMLGIATASAGGARGNLRLPGAVRCLIPAPSRRHRPGGAGGLGPLGGIQNAFANLAGVLAALVTAYLIPDTQHFAAAFVAAATVSCSALSAGCDHPESGADFVGRA
jgi:ribulose-5-phosphate 4-epimerase/fuculose-1-phosphate aldolase/MFS family permease